MEKIISDIELLKQAEEKNELIYRNLKRNHSKVKNMNLYSDKIFYKYLHKIKIY